MRLQVPLSPPCDDPPILPAARAVRAGTTHTSTRLCWCGGRPRRGRSTLSATTLNALRAYIDPSHSRDTCACAAAVSPAQRRSMRTRSMRPRGHSPVSSAAYLHPRCSITSTQLICARSIRRSSADTRCSCSFTAPLHTPAQRRRWRRAAEEDVTQPMRVGQRIAKRRSKKSIIAGARFASF